MKIALRAQLGLAVISSILLAGCASVAVTGDALEKNTAFAIGAEPGTFTISDRQDQGLKTTYRATTSSGKKYSCYVTGMVSVVGRTVSDAMCNEITSGSAAKAGAPASKAPAAPCNALLKAAGRCK